MPSMADPGAEWSHEQAEEGSEKMVLRTGPEPLFSLIDDGLDGRTVPGSYSPCDCIGRRGEVDEIRRLIATARATLARATKG